MIPEVQIQGLLLEDAASLQKKIEKLLYIPTNISKSSKYEGRYTVTLYNVNEEDCLKIRMLSDTGKAQNIAVRGTKACGRAVVDASEYLADDIFVPFIRWSVRQSYKAKKGAEELKDKIKNIRTDNITEPITEGGRFYRLKNKFKNIGK